MKTLAGKGCGSEIGSPGVCILAHELLTHGGGRLRNSKFLIAQAYAAFNRRDIDAALAVMSETVDWPKASEGGRAVGKEEIRAYWTRQWADFDPHVDPVDITDREPGKTEVKVRQIVKNRDGEVLLDQSVLHVYTIANGLIERMDIGEGEGVFGHKHAG
jgi:hypothetical protein